MDKEKIDFLVTVAENCGSVTLSREDFLQFVRERDAAVKDISLLIIGNQPFTDPCKICKHRFGADPCQCLECDEITPYGNFEWRGVDETN